MKEMTLHEMYEKALEIYNANESKFYLIGLRYEDLDREIGDELDWSKDNPDREDEREFPAYGTPEYDELPTLDGTSAWHFDPATGELPGYGAIRDGSKEASRQFDANHCYVIAGKRQGHHDCPDDGEILIRDAVVVGKLF